MQTSITKPVSFSTKFLNDISNLAFINWCFIAKSVHKQQILVDVLTRMSNVIQHASERIVTSIQFPFSNS